MLRKSRSSVPRITISPQESLADESIKIKIENLRSYQNVTVQATLKRSDVGTFESFARYTADDNGAIDLMDQPSLGGTFSGIEPMGLFWSMKPSPTNGRNQNRMVIKDVFTPAEECLRIFDSHLNYEELHDIKRDVLAEATSKRWFKRPGVQRIQVRWKRVRGALFVPEGNGPFPAVIDTFGTGGGLVEHRASLLASRGYLCLALAIFAYDDLPSEVELREIDLSYFEEAKEFLESRPEAKQNGIGIVGTSYGGTLALACATYLPGFKCAISVSGPIFVFFKPLKYKRRQWPAIPVNMKRACKLKDGIVTKYTFDDCFGDGLMGNSLIEFAKSNKSFLFILAEDDDAYNAPKTVSVIESLIKEGKGKYCVIAYPDAGHLLEPPYLPHVESSYVTLLSDYQKWGGTPKMHAKAQERSWQTILSFLKENLTCDGSKL